MHGVSLRRYPAELKKAVAEETGFPSPLEFVLSINHTAYAEGLTQSLLQQGKSVAEIKKLVSEDAFHVPLLGAENIVRHVLIGLLLQGVIVHEVYGTYTVSYQSSMRMQECRLVRYIAFPREEVGWSRFLDFPDSPEFVIGRKLKKVIMSTNVYYQPGAKHDRLSVALNSLWVAVFSRYRDQGFLSLTTLLEALFSTGSSEITHTLSERTALLLGKSATERIEIYERVKKLYNTRSKIIHGRQVRKDESGESSSREDFQQIYSLAVDVIHATLNNSALLRIIQSDKRDESISQQLTHFYLTF
jgi:hypothetical protein